MNHLRCAVILPKDYPHRATFETAMVAAWGQIVHWIEWHTDTILRFRSPQFISTELTGEQIATEATRDGGNLPAFVFNSYVPSSPFIVRESIRSKTDAVLIFVPMGGNYAGAQMNGAESYPWAMVGESVFGPLMRHYGLPEWDKTDRFPKDFEGIHDVNTAFGTALHELSHLWGLRHPSDHLYGSPVRIQNGLYRNIMDEHMIVDIEDIEKGRYIPIHKNIIRRSKYMQGFQTHKASASLWNRFNQWTADLVRARNVELREDVL